MVNRFVIIAIVFSLVAAAIGVVAYYSIPSTPQRGTGQIEFAATSLGNLPITFSPAFNAAPLKYGVTLTSIKTTAGFTYVQYSDIPLYSGLSVNTTSAESFDTSVLVPDVGSNTWSQAITPSSVNEFAVVELVDGLGNCPGVTGYSVSDSQNNIYTQRIALCDNNNANALLFFTAKLSAAVSTTITALGGGSSQFGGVIALYKGVGWVGNTCTHKATALSDSCTLSVTKSGEFVVGGTALDVFANGLGHIDTITAGAGQTSRQNDFTNAIPFAVVNYDLEDKQINVGSAALPVSVVYSSSYNATDGDAIAAMELQHEVTPEWSLSNVYQDIYNVPSFDVKYTIPAAELNSPTLTMFFVCTAITNTAMTYNVGFFNNGVLVGSLGPIAGSTLCTGNSISIAIVPTAGSGPWTIKAECTAVCGNDFALFPSIYMVFSYQVLWQVSLYFCNVSTCNQSGGSGPTATGGFIVGSLNQIYPGPTGPTGNNLNATFTWWAEP